MIVRIKDIALVKMGWNLKQLHREYDKKFPNDITYQTLLLWASRSENKRVQPRYDQMEKLCYILKCDMGELFKVERLKFDQ